MAGNVVAAWGAGTAGAVRAGISNWLASIALAGMVGGQYLAVDVGIYFYVVAAAMVMLAVAAILRFRAFSLPRAVALMALCVAPLIISTILNGVEINALIPPVVLAGFALTAYAYGRMADQRDWELLLGRSTALSILALMLASAIHGWDFLTPLKTGSRIEAGMHPNLFGLTALALVLLYVGTRRALVLSLVVGVVLVACLAANSRSAILTVLVVAIASRFMILGKRPVLLTALVTTLLFGATFLLAFNAERAGALADAVFHINDRYRGLGSGGSGRLEIWPFFIDAWEKAPLFGPGPGTVYEIAGRAVYSHNLLLQLLVDSGLVGLIAFGVFLVLVFRATRAANVPAILARTCLLALLAYFIYGLFEGRAVNIGNPLSCVFFFFTFATLGAAEGARRMSMATTVRRGGGASWSKLQAAKGTVTATNRTELR